ncbi:MAG: hypothetical protein Q9226_009104, partial [Calogaya cf. arnoldii]
TISNDHVFFMSGSYKIVGPDGNVSEWRHEKSLFALDLTKPFPVEDLISTDVLQNISVPLGLMPDIEDQTAASWSGALFPTNESLYIYGSGSSSLFGGTDPASATLNTLARYDSTKEQWSSALVAGGDLNHDARLWGQVATDPVDGTSFFTGGANNVRGMLVFHAADPTQVSWTNSTQVGDISDSNPHVIAGGMVFLPVGTSDALLLLGGANPTTFANQTSGPNRLAKNKWNMMPMDVVHIYDIESNKWFPVSTTSSGPNFPSGRAQFCLAVSRAPDDSSFQVTMFHPL